MKVSLFEISYNKKKFTIFFFYVPVYVFLEFVFILFCSLFFVKRERFKRKLKKIYYKNKSVLIFLFL